MLNRRTLVTVVLSTVTLNARAQPPRDAPSPSAVQKIQISGRVVADASGDAIANARVSLLGGLHGPVILSDVEGRFAISVPAGRYSVSARKTGYAAATSPVADTAQPIELRLPRAAVISGRVADELGDPVVGARVTAERAMTTSRARYAAAAAVDTDDRGEFRIGNLSAGTFVVTGTCCAMAPILRFRATW